jgi:hypothetical protein
MSANQQRIQISQSRLSVIAQSQLSVDDVIV